MHRSICLFLLLFISYQLTLAQAEINFMPRLKGNDITYYALSKNFENMAAFQFSLNWNPDSMQYKSLEFRKDMVYGKINPQFSKDGKILMLWFSESLNYSLPDCDTIFTVKFQKKTGPGKLRITSDPLAKEVIKEGGKINLKSSIIPYCGITPVKDESGESIRFELQPNITVPSNKLYLNTNSTADILIEVYDIGGQLVQQHKMAQERFFNAPSVSGLYIYRIIQNNKVVFSDRFVVQ